MARPKKNAPSLAARGNKADESVTPKESEATMSDSSKPYKSKIHAVELALEKLGWDAMPAKIRDYVRDKFNLEMSTAHIGVNKTSVLRKRGIIAGPDGTPEAPRRKVGRPRGTKKTAQKGTIAVESFDTIRELLKDFKADTLIKVGEVIDKIGVTQLREVVRLLS